MPVSVQLATIAREFELRRRRPADAADRQRLLLARGAALERLRLRPGARRHLDDYRSDTGRRGADRDDFADSSDFIGWYMAGASRVNGLPPHDTYNHYLAYHEGKAGYARGSYRAKSWLPAVARDVEGWAARYDAQLAGLPDARR